MNTRTRRQGLVTSCAGLLLTLFFSAAALAAPGAIWTSLIDGATVNSNLYEHKDDVYLNGGPNNNTGGSGIPDGLYYFMVTDPSGAVLLSQDDINCRRVIVVGGRIAGHDPAASCFHPNGTTTLGTPVKLMPYADTPNSGGEYKAWLVPVGEYDPTRTNCTFGFCGGNIKTDNFKVQNAGPAYIVACKYNDLNGNGVQDVGEGVIPEWPISATGVDGGTVSLLTDLTGCVNFVVSTFPASVTITEGTLGQDWVETAPADGSRARSGTTPAYTVTHGVVTTTDLKGGDILDIDFGNHNPDCAVAGSCTPPDCIVRGQCTDVPGLQVSKTANPAYKVNWTIDKQVDKTRINTSSTSPTANYTVTVTHDVGTGFVVNGKITVSNPSIADAGGVTVADAVDNGGNCTVQNNGVVGVLHAGEAVELTYTCTYPDQQVPAAGTNTATATWLTTIGAVSSSGTAAVDFSQAVVVDGSVNVTDTMGGTLGTASYTDAATTTYTYSKTLSGTAGTCVDVPNTATFTSTTPNSTATGSASASVKVCVGLDPTVSKTAAPSFKRSYTWSLAKAVDKTSANISGGTATFNYTVTATQTGVSDSDWQVTGIITVTNPNDWEAITVNVSDAIPNGGTCTITGGASLTVAASSSGTKNYTCTYASAPTANDFVNTATVTWNSTTYATPTGSASGTASGAFGAPSSTVDKTITVKDVFNGGAPATLGDVTGTESAPFTTKDFTYSHSVGGTAGTCTDYANTATFTSADSSATGSASKTVKVCVGKDLTVSKTVTPSFARNYLWSLVKNVDKTRINTSATTATFNYTVTATQTGVSDSGWQAVGTITVSNPNDWEDVTVSLADAVDNGGTCALEAGGSSFTVAKSSSVTKNYTCSYASAPSAASLTNTATATWDSAAYFTPTGTASGTATGGFTTPTSTTNKTITVKDNFNGGGAATLGTVTGTDAPAYATSTFNYAHTVNGTAGSCTTYNNTATFSSADGASGSASQSVQICVGANLTVSKTAAPAYTRTYFWEILKSVDRNLVILGGTVNYAVTVNQTGVADSGWTVVGSITVTNPNTWQSVTFNVADAIDNGGSCTVTGGSGVVLAAGASVTKSYTCTYSANPGSAAFTNTATATWDSSAFFTPSGSATGTAGGAFAVPTSTVNQTVNVTDTMQGALGTVTANDAAPLATQTFTYAKVLAPPVNGCVVQNNTATIVQTNQSASATVTTCGLGEHTIGYWQNKNGQGVLAAADQADLGDYLRSFHAFSDAPSSNIAAYVKGIIKVASCNGPTCNSMLRAQMLGTALNVYFSDDTVGVNVFNSPIPMGSAVISLTNPENVSAAFGGATSMSIMEMLLYQNLADPAADAGAYWYAQVKALQVLAKDAFDNINNGKMVGP